MLLTNKYKKEDKSEKENHRVHLDLHDGAIPGAGILHPSGSTDTHTNTNADTHTNTNTNADTHANNWWQLVGQTWQAAVRRYNGPSNQQDH